jgi:hypothetical protein
MPWLNAIVLLSMAIGLAAVNLWNAAVRSTIPLALHGKITEIELRREKHPGKDDVFVLRVDSGITIHIDAQLAQELEVGQRLDKIAWQTDLEVVRDGDESTSKLSLKWSRDYYGMCVAMPLVLIVYAVTSVVVIRSCKLDDEPKDCQNEA